MWWDDSVQPSSFDDSVQPIVAELRDDAGVTRQHWAASFPRVKDTLKEHQRLFDEQLRASVNKKKQYKRQPLIDLHDAGMQAIHEAHRLIYNAKRALNKLRQAEANIHRRLGELEADAHAFSWRFGNRKVRKEYNALSQLYSEYISPDLLRIQTEYDRLVSELSILKKQAKLLQALVRDRCGPLGELWFRDVEKRMIISEANWERAERGLPPLPLPRLTVQPPETRVRGVVKWYDALREIGMIEPEEGAGEIFVSRKQLHGITMLHKGQQVGFIIKQSRNGPWASNVIRVRK